MPYRGLGFVGFVTMVLAAGVARSAEAEDLSEGTTFLDMLVWGYACSPLITVIFAVLAFLALFLCFHLLLSTRSSLVVPGPLLRHLLDDVASRDFEAAQRRAEESPALFARAILPGLKLHDHPVERIHQAVEGSGRRVIGGLRQEATYLANIGVLSPMLGLLGTVLGLMRAFQVMGAEEIEQGSKTLMMSSAIGQAMSTTAMGLLVGIPVMGVYYLCLSRVGRISDEVEIASEEVVAAIGEMK